MILRDIVSLAVAVSLSLTGDGGGDWPSGTFSAPSEAMVATLTNDARAQAGAGSLTVDDALADVARWRARDMAERDYFGHVIPEPPGGDVFDELDQRGICYRVAGENIGENDYPDGVATETLIDAWLESAPHRAVMLNGDLTRIGVGAFEAVNGDHYWAVIFAADCGPLTSEPTPRPTMTMPPTVAPTVRPPAVAAPTLRPTEDDPPAVCQ